MRSATKQSKWSKAVRKRDGYICNICLSTTDLTAHHLNSGDFQNQYCVADGICLCATCHQRFHQAHFQKSKYKKIHCTAKDYEIYRSKSIEKKARPQGKEAFYAGLTRCDNPYPSTSIGYDYWDRAFQFTRQETIYKSYEEYIT